MSKHIAADPLLLELELAVNAVLSSRGDIRLQRWPSTPENNAEIEAGGSECYHAIDADMVRLRKAFAAYCNMEETK